MNEPTFDRNGYPSEETEIEIAHWDALDWKGLVRFMLCAWSVYGRAEIKGSVLELATGGWSGNEDLIGALHRNFVACSMMWESSHRGGLHRYDLRRMAKMTAREKMKPAPAQAQEAQ